MEYILSSFFKYVSCAHEFKQKHKITKKKQKKNQTSSPSSLLFELEIKFLKKNKT